MGLVANIRCEIKNKVNLVILTNTQGRHEISLVLLPYFRLHTYETPEAATCCSPVPLSLLVVL